MDNELLNMDGIIVFDNALRGGYPYLPETTAEAEPNGWAIKTCNELVSADPRVRCVSIRTLPFYYYPFSYIQCYQAGNVIMYATPHLSLVPSEDSEATSNLNFRVTLIMISQRPIISTCNKSLVRRRVCPD